MEHKGYGIEGEFPKENLRGRIFEGEWKREEERGKEMKREEARGR